MPWYFENRKRQLQLNSTMQLSVSINSGSRRKSVGGEEVEVEEVEGVN